MMKENKSKEKICLFFASDYHFEMITLPYINEKLKENKNIVIVTENNLEETMQKVISRVNLDENEKEKILKIDWKSDDFSKFKEIKELNKESDEVIVFVKGKENYINNINENINNWGNLENLKIIDCYDVNELQEDITNISGKYNKVLSTSGISKL